MDVANKCSEAATPDAKLYLPSHHEITALQPSSNDKTSDFYETQNIPDRFDHPSWFKGYENKEESPMFRTTNSQYGGKAPSVHTMPQQFRARSQKFTNHLGKCGMYRDKGLNTGVDKAPVPDHFKGHMYY